MTIKSSEKFCVNCGEKATVWSEYKGEHGGKMCLRCYAGYKEVEATTEKKTTVCDFGRAGRCYCDEDYKCPSKAK